MSTFSVFPPNNSKLYRVMGVDEFEHKEFATCTSEEIANRAQEIFRTAGLETIVVIDHVGLNAVMINEERIDLTQESPKLTM